MSSASSGPSGPEDEFQDPDFRSLGDNPKELLEQVLNETLSAPDDMSAAEIETLRGVASRFAGHPLDDHGVAALVESMVRSRFSHLSDSDAFWATMSNWIARTLWDDPESKSRLEALWRGLGEN